MSPLSDAIGLSVIGLGAIDRVAQPKDFRRILRADGTPSSGRERVSV
jgi:hypothetical protein